MDENGRPVEESAELIEAIILVTGRALRRAYDVRFSAFGLNMSEAGLLRAIAAEGALTQRELADRLYIGRAGAGQFIDRLEARDMVRRDPDPVDRRVWKISLTPDGEVLADSLNDVYAGIRSELRAGLTSTDRLALAKMLTRINANAEKVVSGDGVGGERTQPLRSASK
jgi:DNA-binding MarR family transcriptional regulator